MLLFDHFLGPNNVGNMASASDTKLIGTLYNGEKKRFTWETYVRIHTEQHLVINGLKDYGYVFIDDSSKVGRLLKGIKTTELDVCKTQVMASPYLRDDFSATVELYSTFIKQMKV
jgi:heptaprenylglyceryl phosphate synthase